MPPTPGFNQGSGSKLLSTAPTPGLTFSSPSNAPGEAATCWSPTTPLGWLSRHQPLTPTALTPDAALAGRKRSRPCTPPNALTPARHRTAAKAAQSASAQRISEPPSKCSSARRLKHTLDKEERVWERAFTFSSRPSPHASFHSSYKGQAEAKHMSPTSPPGSPSSRLGKKSKIFSLHNSDNFEDEEEEEEKEGDVSLSHSPSMRAARTRRSRSTSSSEELSPSAGAAQRQPVSPGTLDHLRALSAAQLRWAHAARGGRTPLQPDPGQDKGRERTGLALLSGTAAVSDSELDPGLDGRQDEGQSSPTPSRPSRSRKYTR